MKVQASYLLFIILLTSCISDTFTIGKNLTEINGRNMLIESSTVDLNTYISDSTVTTGLSRIFEGNYHSPDFGIITAHSYFNFNPPSYSASEFGSDAIAEVRFDSITLTLRYDNFSYGDTTQIQKLNIYRLREIINLDDKNQLYTSSSIASETDSWASFQFKRPTEHSENDTTLILRLPDEFGLELFELMGAQSDLLETFDSFQNYFKGLKLSPEIDNNAAINSFKVNDEYPLIKIHYTVIGASSNENKEIDMTPNTSTAFSQIGMDRSNTLLASLTSNNSLSSSETDNRAYLQGLIGIYTKLSFPDLNEILKLGDYVLISSATLYIFPIHSTYNLFTPLPKSLSLNYLDESGKPIDIYVDASTTTVQSGSLVEDPVYNRNTYYAFDITSYIEYELGLLGMYKTSLQLSLSDSEKNNTLKSLVIGDSDFPDADNRIKLIINAVVYDTH